MFLLVIVIGGHNNSVALCPLFTTQLLFATTTRSVSDDIRLLIRPFVVIIITCQQEPGRLTDGHWQIIFRQRMGYWIKWMLHRRLQRIRFKLRNGCLLRGWHCRSHYCWCLRRRSQELDRDLEQEISDVLRTWAAIHGIGRISSRPTCTHVVGQKCRRSNTSQYDETR